MSLDSLRSMSFIRRIYVHLGQRMESYHLAPIVKVWLMKIYMIGIFSLYYIWVNVLALDFFVISFTWHALV